MKYPERPQAMPVPYGMQAPQWKHSPQRMQMPHGTPQPMPAAGPPGPTPMMEEYYQALHDLQAIDFVLVELTLYLNTHQDDTDALDQFNRTAAQREQLKREFEARFGPLTQFQSQAGAPFSWADLPWPWEV